LALTYVSTKNEGLQQVPVADRVGDQIFTSPEIGYGGFAVLVGTQDGSVSANSNGSRNLYVVGADTNGLQVARVPLGQEGFRPSYQYWDSVNAQWNSQIPAANATAGETMVGGSFTSGDMFYSPYLKTFVIVHMDDWPDSMFFMRYLDLSQPLHPGDDAWPVGGRNGKAPSQLDVEHILHYKWTDSQILYKSPPGNGGYNYLGAVHAQYFNRQYYPQSPEFQQMPGQTGQWYGGEFVPEPAAGQDDGKHLMLSWTAQVHGGADTGVYQIQMAVVTLGPIEPGFIANSTSNSSNEATTEKQPKGRKRTPRSPIPSRLFQRLSERN
jgi:hypothetical protein